MSSTTETKTQQSAQTDPYAPAVPLLGADASQVGGMSTAITPEQATALANLQAEAARTPDLSKPATNAITGNLTASTAPQQGMLSQAIQQYMANTSPLANNTNLNPWSTPGFSDAINALNTNIGQSVTSQFAGAGRDPTGNAAAPAAMARQEALAEAPIVQSQYQNNVGNLLNANQGQFGTASMGSQALTAEQMAALNQQLSGAQTGLATLPGLLTMPASNQLAAANTAYSTPWTNLNPSLSAAEGIGGMGGTSFGTGTTSQTSPALTNTIGLLTGLAGIAGAFGRSDARVKENIEPVGKLHDGQTVHRFNFKDDPMKTPVIGLLAQEVEKVRPDAVHTLGGVKHVDYKAATEHARHLGMLAA